MRHLTLQLLALTTISMVSLAEEQVSYIRREDPHGLTVFMREGGWCWFQDPRAMIHDNKLFMGSVQGNGAGAALVGVYDLTAGRPLGTVTMHPTFDADDHNSPVFHVRPDGSILAVYARHNRNRYHDCRVSDPHDPLNWSDEVKHERVMPNPQDRVTYMNLYDMRDEDKLFLFFRGIDFNPTFVTSDDHGQSWSEPVHLFSSEIAGRHRPYARYAGNGRNTIFASITDAHPRDFGNSIYFFAFRDGNFYRADGARIKSLSSGGPLLPSEAELVYQGTGRPGRGHDLSALGAAWTSSIQIDKQGHPHIAYTVYHGNLDHRYRIASWNGTRWIDREVAYGGKCLYDRESSYTGLIALDPVDPEVVFISTDVSPKTGKDRGG